MTALATGTANAVQRAWCASLLARMPAKLARVRTRIEETRAWLEQHPTRTLHPAYRERLLRYENLLDARDAARVRPRASRATAKALPRQLALLPESRKEQES